MRWRDWKGLSAPAPRGAGRWALGAVAFLAAIGLWLGPMLWMALSDGDPAHRTYVQDLLFRQTATRYADPWHHTQPAWYFARVRSEEHTSELQSLMRISYAVFCLKKKKPTTNSKQYIKYKTTLIKT